MESNEKAWIFWKEEGGKYVVAYGRIVGQCRDSEGRDLIGLQFDNDAPLYVRGQLVWYPAYRIKRNMTPQEYFISKQPKPKREKPQFETAAEYNKRISTNTENQHWTIKVGNFRFCKSCNKEAHYKPAENCTLARHAEYYKTRLAAKHKPQTV